MIPEPLLALVPSPCTSAFSGVPYATPYREAWGNKMEDTKSGRVVTPSRRRRGCRGLRSLSPVPTLHVRAQDTLRETQCLADAVSAALSWKTACHRSAPVGGGTHHARGLPYHLPGTLRARAWLLELAAPLSTFVSLVPSETCAVAILRGCPWSS